MFEEIKVKIEKLSDSAAKRGQRLEVENIAAFVRSCQSFVERVSTIERVYSIDRYGMDSFEYRATISEIFQGRDIAFKGMESWIAQLNRISNLYFGENFVDLPESREEAQKVLVEMAKAVSDQYFEKGKTRTPENTEIA